MNIMVGSTNQIKATAVEAACRAIGIQAVISTTAADSGIPVQPVGREETALGARNRARRARDRSPESFTVGIENGLCQTEHGWQDWAVIVILCPNGAEVLMESATTDFPSEIVEEAQRRGFETATAGQILAERFGSNPNDPHSFLTEGRDSRLKLLTETIKTALRQALTRNVT